MFELSVKLVPCWLLSLSVFIAVTASNCAAVPTDSKAQKEKLRIGWQTTWATQGQLSLILQKTDILSENGFEGDFKGFSYGGPLNQAALAGEVDVVFTADQPALTLLSRDSNWQIVGRLMYNSGALMVHPNSGIKSVADLKGTTVAVPFVAAVHRVLIDLEKQAGLIPGKDVKNINLGINEIINVAQSGKDKGWGDVSAMMVWDPTPFILERKKLTSTIARGDIVAVVLMRKDKIAGDSPNRFMQAMKSAYWYYANNREKANQWFADSARIDYDPSILDLASAFEPNLSAKTKEQVRVVLNKDDMNTLEEVSKFMLSQKLIKKQVSVKDYVYSGSVG